MIYNTFVGIDAAYKVPWTKRFCNSGKCLCNQHLLRRKKCIETKKNQFKDGSIKSRFNFKIKNFFYLLFDDMHVEPLQGFITAGRGCSLHALPAGRFVPNQTHCNIRYFIPWPPQVALH